MADPKTTNIVQRLNNLRQENENLKSQIETLNQQLLEAKIENSQLKDKYDRVKMARAYGWNNETKKNATDRITQMVREIDYCLALLKKIQ